MRLSFLRVEAPRGLLDYIRVVLDISYHGLLVILWLLGDFLLDGGDLDDLIIGLHREFGGLLFGVNATSHNVLFSLAMVSLLLVATVEGLRGCLICD